MGRRHSSIWGTLLVLTQSQQPLVPESFCISLLQGHSVTVNGVRSLRGHLGGTLMVGGFWCL